MLVEGESDRVALETLAAHRGRCLPAEGVAVGAMGGITNTRAFATRYGPRGAGMRLVGLYDVGEEDALRRGLAAAGLDPGPTADGLRALGFFGWSLPRLPLRTQGSLRRTPRRGDGPRLRPGVAGGRPGRRLSVPPTRVAHYPLAWSLSFIAPHPCQRSTSIHALTRARSRTG